MYLLVTDIFKKAHHMWCTAQVLLQPCDFTSHLHKSANSETTLVSSDCTNTGIDLCDTPATGSAATTSP